MRPMRIEEEWEVGRLRLRLMICDGTGTGCQAAVRVLAGERDEPATDWLCVCYMPREDFSYDEQVRGELEDEDIQEAVLQGIALCGTRWPVSCYAGDETARVWDGAPPWMVSVPVDEVKRIRRWCWGVDWLKVPAALVELRYCTTICDRPVKPGIVKP